MRRRRATGSDLDTRLLALGEAVAAGEGVVEPEALADARSLVDRAGERLGHGLDHTVVALAGATGSGKSSLFNGLVGAPVSTVGVRRPTTSRTSAAVWGSGADDLLDWLEVPNRHAVDVAADDPRCGLVLLDLPDHDSTEASHRVEVDRVVRVADMVVWVLDPQKYADAAVHEGYLRPLASHSAVLLVVLNQSDRLDEAALAACRKDLDRLLDDDGLRDVGVLATSATTGGGVAELRDELTRRVVAREAAVARLEADVGDAADRLAAGCDHGRRASIRDEDRDRVVDAMAAAGGVRTVADAVARSHQSRGAASVGWPFTRWLGRLRPDPLRRLHLERAGGTAARSSLPPPSEVSIARLDTAIRDLADHLGAGLQPAWVTALRASARSGLDALATRLDATVASTDLGVERAPRWWAVVGGLQWLLALVALAGAIWLAVLAGLGYLQLGDPGTPELREIPMPTAMLLGGGVLGLVIAALARPFVALGARRRARRAERRLREGIAVLADDAVLAPVESVVDRHRTLCDAVRRAAA